MYTVGIDVGASSIKAVALDGERNVLIACRVVHEGSPLDCTKTVLADIAAKLPAHGCAGIVATGSGASALKNLAPDLVVLEDVPAATMGAEVMAPTARCIMCIGGQSTLFVSAPDAPEKPARDASGNPISPWRSGAPVFATNESCAAGTGSFFEDQMGRLGMVIEDYSSMVARATSVPRLSGRCTVFAKTDIIHRQQEGVSVEDILQGLCHAMVKSFKATVVRGIAWKPPLLLAGGVVLNAGVVRAVREVFDLQEGELIASPDMVYVQAAGAALHAQDAHSISSLEKLEACLESDSQVEALPRNEVLPQLVYDPGLGYPAEHLLTPTDTPPATRIQCALGVDVGSTSTNLVLIDREGNLLDAQYLRTRGNPREVVKEGLASIGNRLGNQIEVISVGATGSGRQMIGELIGADIVRDEITAQARGAAAADPQVDTVFEIGGQDSKYIHLAAGQVNDFQMNKVCAAGTGSFVEEQALRLGIPLPDYGDIALSAQSPVDLGERCTVFVETAIHTALAKGASMPDVAAGLCQSIVRNYLHRVVAGKPVGERIVLQGGVAYNPGIVAAFKQYYADRLSVSPWFAVSGAVGVAHLALEDALSRESRAAQTGDPALLGDPAAPAAPASAPAAPAFAPAAPASTFRGFYLERDTSAHARKADAAQIAKNRAYFRKTEELYLEGYDPTIDPAKKTVGVPRCLMMHKMFPMVNGFFRTLGYNVIVSDPSSEETVRLSQQAAQGEVCYPVKLIHGHMMQLLEKNVDYIFFPSVHTIRHLKSKSPHNYACTYMQTGPSLLAKELGLEERGVKLLSPLFELDFGQESITSALLKIGQELGHSPHETARAMLAGGNAIKEYSRKTEDLGEELLNSLGPNERVIVLITRQYNVQDPALNMGIAEALLDRGQKVIMVSHLRAHDLDISRDYPGVYWPFGQHLISGAKIIRRDPRLFAVYLTNHGCGPDTMVTHYFKDEMGDKPYLQIEMDEHYSKVGVITRIEAFLNAIEHYTAPDERALPLSVNRPDGATEPLVPTQPAAMPSIGLYGTFASRWLRATYQVDPQLIGFSEEVVATGQEETQTKEYLTFAAFLGASLTAAAAHDDARDDAHDDARDDAHDNTPAGTESAALPLQLLLPSTEGCEADGQYDRVIRTILDEQGKDHVRIIAPKLEQLPWTLDDPHGFFAAILAADVCYAAPAPERARIAEKLLSGPLGLARVTQVAQEVAALKPSQPDQPKLSVVGEWPLVYADELTGGVLSRLEEQGLDLARMPFAEFLLFLWRDAADADQRERNLAPFMLDAVSQRSTMELPAEALAHEQQSAHHAGCDSGACAGCDSHEGVSFYGANAPAAPSSDNHEFDAHKLPNFAISHAEKVAALETFEQEMALVAQALGERSPFASSLEALRTEADKVVGPYRGANGRYRAAKVMLPPQGTRGILSCASMYENTEIMLKLREGFMELPVPVLHLSFDSVLDKTMDGKVKSFLYYL